MAALHVDACGYNCQFVEAIPKDLLQTECSICLHIVRDPLMVDCCGYRFCRGCIEPLTSSRGKRCPLCNCSFTTAVQDKLLKRTLNQKRVYCGHKESGCEWVGELAEFDKHLNAQPQKEVERMEGCSYQELECIYCSASFQRCKMTEHELECPERVMTCEYCNLYRVKWANMVQHWKWCDYYLIHCPNDGCEAVMKRMNLSKHVEEQCPHTVIACDYAYAGCEVELPRKEMSDHLDNCAKDHVSLLSKLCSKQEQKLENVWAQLKDVQAQLERIEIEHSKELEELVQSRQDCHLLKELADLRGEPDYDESEREILVTNLSDYTEEHMIKSLFGQHGRVSNIDFYCCHHMAVVQFEYSYSVDRVFEYEKTLAKGLRLRGSKLHCVRLSYSS